MKPDPEADVLGENLRRALGASREASVASRAEFLRRAGEPAARGSVRRPPAGLLTVAASLLVCAGIVAVIVSSAVKEPPILPPDSLLGQEKKAPPDAKFSTPEELGLAEQIAFQEALLTKTTDEKERALVQATIRTLQAELARAQKGKSAVKKSPEAVAERMAQLRTDLENVQVKLKTAKTLEDTQRLEAKAAALAEELGSLEKGNQAPFKTPEGKGSGKPDPNLKDVPRKSKDTMVRIADLEERLGELKATMSTPGLSDADRAKAKEEFVLLQAELERLKAAAAPGDKKK
jgi:hypothetical protein